MESQYKQIYTIGRSFGSGVLSVNMNLLAQMFMKNITYLCLCRGIHCQASLGLGVEALLH